MFKTYRKKIRACIYRPDRKFSLVIHLCLIMLLQLLLLLFYNVVEIIVPYKCSSIGRYQRHYLQGPRFEPLIPHFFTVKMCESSY